MPRRTEYSTSPESTVAAYGKRSSHERHSKKTVSEVQNVTCTAPALVSLLALHLRTFCWLESEHNSQPSELLPMPHTTPDPQDGIHLDFVSEAAHRGAACRP